ncbi:MAG: ribbon-helix-helix domain-containing protein [Thermoanaerobaculales bacterium]|nr:ribbon-helix-helix domain-containing protein [Thermoanaerobaculales bacterium]
MTSTTVRIPESTRASLRHLAQVEGRPMQAVLKDAIEAYRRKIFLDRLNSAYASLTHDERQGLRQEVGEWDLSLQDGLNEF